MPTTVTASENDTLCGIAVASGFLNCDPLRSDPANVAFLNRPLQAGDIVTVPDKKKNLLQKAAEALHPFKRKGVPAPAIRIVHGSQDKAYRDDAAAKFLNVSNYISNKGGADGQSAFPSSFGFDASGHSDLDAFKVEVIDPNGGGTVMADLEALKPVYASDGSVTSHESFTDAQAGLRKIKVECKKVSDPKFKGYRSRYLRLVTDEEDLKTLSGDPVKTDGSAQGLFTSDMADGNNGDADKVEILDQVVQAAYVIKGCKATAPNKCKVQVQLPIGPNRTRIKVCFHLFRSAVGGSGVGGVTEQNLRRRTFKWYRRAYAQAELAPKLVAPFVELVDPPAANMLVISNNHGNPVSGATSTLSFDLDVAPGATPAPPVQNVAVNLTAGQTPDQVASVIVATLPAGFAGQAFTNAPAFDATNGSVDILISRDDGQRVVIRNETTTDSNLTVAVARVNLNSVDNNHPGKSLIPASIDFRRVIRAAPGADDQMDCYVIGQFVTFGLRGRAFVVAADLPPAFQSPSPLRWATVMAANSDSGAVMDGSDNLPFTYPHESGHALLDAFHTKGAGANTELMSGSGTSAVNSVTATKRLCDDPVHIQYAMFQPQPSPSVGASTTEAISATQRLRLRGANVFDDW